MKTYPSDDGSVVLVSLERGEDLLDGLARAIDELGFETASIELIGGLDEAVVGYYDRGSKEYRPITATHVEIASGLGNVSLRDGRPFVHLHLVVSGADGSALGGHALEGCLAFIVEAVIRPFKGAAPTRREQPDIRLSVWPAR